MQNVTNKITWASKPYDDDDGDDDDVDGGVGGNNDYDYDDTDDVDDSDDGVAADFDDDDGDDNEDSYRCLTTSSTSGLLSTAWRNARRVSINPLTIIGLP